MADAMQILFNEAMKVERNAFVNAEPYERTAERRGHGTGFKPKTVKSRVSQSHCQLKYRTASPMVCASLTQPS
jgi:hypothetical protein